MYPRRRGAVDRKECDNALKRDTRPSSSEGWGGRGGEGERERARAFPKGYINFPFRGNFNQFTIHAVSTYAQPRAVVIRAANQKLSSEQPTGWPSMQQAETSAHSLKRGERSENTGGKDVRGR